MGHEAIWVLITENMPGAVPDYILGGLEGGELNANR
jgi:hypothetical protein